MRVCLCGGGEKANRGEGEGRGGGRGEVGLSAHICTPVSGDLPPIWEETAAEAGQYSGNRSE